ncbi:hypothetical protein [Microbulbifer discodermiae]|uniref:hypothetical protein n=1 Tax=Microbulbifer sp. 2201CG32-9 TaxID=3232309 RepID=UPI00345BC48A
MPEHPYSGTRRRNSANFNRLLETWVIMQTPEFSMVGIGFPPAGCKSLLGVDPAVYLAFKIIIHLLSRYHLINFQSPTIANHGSATLSPKLLPGPVAA